MHVPICNFILMFVVLWISCTLTGFGQPIHPDVKKTVVFIYCGNNDGSDLKPIGTGFLVDYPSMKDSSRRYSYLVTAKHVLRKDSVSFHSKIFLRMNKVWGVSVTEPLNLVYEGENQSVYFHDDSAVDVAIMPLWYDETRLDHYMISYSLILSNDDVKRRGVSEGSDVFFVGLFTPYLGYKMIHPICRFGKVALITDEKVAWGKEMMDLYLIEASSYGGNSGAPVFFTNTNSTQTTILAGVMIGYFREWFQVGFIQTSTTIPMSEQNLGIAGVVPAYKLLEILRSQALESRRNKIP